MISIIAAIADDNVIGGDNRMLWSLSEDMRRFKRITTGHPVVMGRKTWESLGRPLPNRRNVVITRDPSYEAPGAEVVCSLEEAVSLFDVEEEIFVIGGGDIYRQAIGQACKLYITRLYCRYVGDTHFPVIDPEQWEVTHREYYPRGENFPQPFEYIDYRRRG